MRSRSRRRSRTALAWLAAAVAGWGTSACALVSPPDELHPDPVVPRTHTAPVGPLEVGAAKVDLTPEDSQWIAGYGPLRASEGVHDPIYARALALRRGELSVVLIAVDVIGLHNNAVEQVRDRLAHRVARDCVLVAATHNHEGPDTMGFWGLPPVMSGMDDAYMERVLTGVALAGQIALEKLGPARVRWAQGQAPARGVSRNKREPERIDRTVTALAFDRPDGTPVATQVHIACLPELLGSKNTLLSADFPYEACAVLEEARPGAVAVFFNGALGGMVTGEISNHTFAEVERVGRAVGQVAVEALAEGEDLEPELELSCTRLPFWAPIQNRSYFLASLFGIFGARVFSWDGYTPSEVQAIRLGPVVWLTAPGEPLPRVGFELEELAGGREPFMLIGLGDDELGYLIHEEDYELDLYDYERTVSPGPLLTTFLRQLAREALAEVGVR